MTFVTFDSNPKGWRGNITVRPNTKDHGMTLLMSRSFKKTFFLSFFLFLYMPTKYQRPWYDLWTWGKFRQLRIWICDNQCKCDNYEWHWSAFAILSMFYTSWIWGFDWRQLVFWEKNIVLLWRKSSIDSKLKEIFRISLEIRIRYTTACAQMFSDWKVLWKLGKFLRIRTRIPQTSRYPASAAVFATYQRGSRSAGSRKNLKTVEFV